MKKIVYLAASLCLLSNAAHALNVTLSVKNEGDGKPTIIGTTNLPDGIELMITIARKESRYMAQDKKRSLSIGRVFSEWQPA